MNHLTLQNGWKLGIDPENAGVAGAWFRAIRADARDTIVPGPIQSIWPGYHGLVWYWREFDWPAPADEGERVLLRFGGVDYLADVWLNAEKLGRHEGPEFPFSFDATRLLRPGRNLLAVRVLNPTTEPIEGIVLEQTPHRNKIGVISSGSGSNYGGIMGAVELAALPAVRVLDLQILPDWTTGVAELVITLGNDLEQAVRARVDAVSGPAPRGEIIVRDEQTVDLPAGETVCRLRLTMPEHRLWSLDEPFLYQVTARVQVTAAENRILPHQTTARYGFRDFRVTEGFFHLNGKRLFLKSTHTGNHCPISSILPPPSNPDLLFRDLIYAKASGFNMVRFICGSPEPAQLDFCDEIGLMVYSETYASWLLGDSPWMAERFDRSLSEMLRRDRNHPSLTVWGLLNETYDGPVFRHAVESLRLVRAHDPTRLVLLSSGRWDSDFGIGSVSSPGSQEWEYVWGDEHPGGGQERFVPPFELPSPGDAQAGDYHFYPRVPHDEAILHHLRTMGRGSKPVFLSEYGIGSQLDVIGEARRYEQAGARPDLEDYVFFKGIADRFADDWRRLGMESVYPFPQDMLRESQRLHARQRTLGLNAIRANPALCGHNLTGMLDHGFSGEGLWTFWRTWKPETFDAIADAWAPLRWCLFVGPEHGFAGRPFRVEAVLANEETLAPGRYGATFRLFGPEGPVWERRTEVAVPEKSPLALPVLSEEVTIDGPAGEYILVANLEGAAPAGDRTRFHVSSPVAARLTGRAIAWGVAPDILAFVRGHGLECVSLEEAGEGTGDVILVGDPRNGPRRLTEWNDLARRIASGAVAVFLSTAAFARGADSTGWLPLPAKGRCYQFYDWLYHREIVIKRHPVFDGLPAPGVLDWSYAGPIFGSAILEGLPEADETIAASFATGHSAFPGCYGCSPVIARYGVGSGQVILNTLRVLENIGAHPAADRLLVNFLRYAARLAAEPGPAAPAPRLPLYEPQRLTPFIRHWEAAEVPRRQRVVADLTPADFTGQGRLVDSGQDFAHFEKLGLGAEGFVMARTRLAATREIALQLLLGPDGPARAWINGRPLGLVPDAAGPGVIDSHTFDLTLPPGEHELLIALDRRDGAAKGFYARLRRPADDWSATEEASGEMEEPLLTPGTAHNG